MAHRAVRIRGVATAAPETPAPPTGQECSRCGQALRPDWNFCPTCSLPARPGKEEVLSSQIEVLRTSAPAGAAAPAAQGGLARWLVAGGMAVLAAATLGVGFLVLSPQGERMLLPDAGNPPAERPPLPGEAEPVRFDWALVPAGPFRYGPPSGDLRWTEEVEVPAFEISRHEVTNAQWRSYLAERRADLETRGFWRTAVPWYWKWRKDPADASGQREEPFFPEGQGALPVHGISFDEADRFCAWLRATGRAPRARLPREDEWEKAARGTDGRTYPWPEAEFILLRHVSGRILEVPRAVVAAPTPNAVTVTDTDQSPCGVYHLGGNVAEWTDLFGRRSRGPEEKYRIIRGAAYQDGLEDGAEYARAWDPGVPMERGVVMRRVGFRVARDPAASRGGR